MAKKISAEKAQILLNDPIEKLIPKMAVPTIIAQMITVVYNLTDTYFVSRLGTAASAAVGVNSTIEHAITMFGMLLGSGTASYIARLLGAKEKKYANQVFTTTLCFAVLGGVLFMGFGLTFIERLVDLLGADSNCRIYSIEYGSYVLLAAPFMIVSYILNQCLRSEGNATLAMVGIGFGGILNCFLDPIFIFSMGLGVKGASIATAISKVVSFFILAYPYIFRKSVMEPSLRYFKLSLVDVKEVLSIGSSSFLRSLCGVISSAIMNRLAGGVSTAMLAAVSISNRVMQFPFNIVLGFGQGYQPVAGFNWGAKQYDRTEKSLKFATAVSIIGGILMGVLLCITARPIIGIFNSAADADVMRYGMLCIRLQSLVLPIHAYLSIINMFFAGLGKPKQALLLSTARQGYCFWSMLYLLPLIFGDIGLVGVQAAADLLSVAVALPLGISATRMAKAKCEEMYGNT